MKFDPNAYYVQHVPSLYFNSDEFRISATLYDKANFNVDYSCVLLAHSS